MDDKMAAEIVRPFVRDEVSWTVEHHGIFQMVYYAEHYGWDPEKRQAFKDSPYYQSCVDFCERWDQCSFDNPDTRVSSHGDYCRCRKRECDSPAPANGGLACSGSALVVTNCTQHGGWTAWSEWSACSQTCGTGLKTRHRQCGNPVPAHGGKVCVGRDVDEQYCEDLAPCDHHTAGSLWDKRPGDSGAWTQWSAWSQCSAQCGRGLRSRQRSCRGIGCSGCDKDWAECEDTACTGQCGGADFI